MDNVYGALYWIPYGRMCYAPYIKILYRACGLWPHLNGQGHLTTVIKLDGEGVLFSESMLKGYGF